MSEKGSVYPCLWFDGNAREASEFYCSVFKQSKITSATDLVIEFEINGSKMMALNGGPKFKFNEAISLVVECETQEEIDHYWNSLTKGGIESMCGWLKDKFGVSWQIVPSHLGILMNQSDAEKRERVMNELLKMKKLNIRQLTDA